MPQQLDSQFEALIQALLDQARASEAGLLNTGQAVPEVLLGLAEANAQIDSPPDLSSREVIRGMFSREQAEQQYVKSLDGQSDVEENQLKRLVAAKLQSDLLAAGQRDFELMRMSRGRALAIEASRRRKHGLDEGPIAQDFQGLPQSVLGIKDNT